MCVCGKALERHVTGPSNIPFDGVYMCTFQPRNCAGWGSEGVKRIFLTHLLLFFFLFFLFFFFFFFVCVERHWKDMLQDHQIYRLMGCTCALFNPEIVQAGAVKLLNLSF